MRIFGVLALTTMLLFSSHVWAEVEHRRLVNFDWEPVDGARGYELEIEQKKKNGKTFNFSVEKALWNGKLAPGPYTMKLRAVDARGVPGDWNEASPFMVHLATPDLVSPAAKELINGDDAKESLVILKWKEVPRATGYHVEVVSTDNEYKKEVDVLGENAKFDLPVAKSYVWRVQATADEGLRSEVAAVGEFNLLGSKLDTPIFDKPENEFIRELTWKRPEQATRYDVMVARLNTKTKKWEKVEQHQDRAGESLNFDAKYPGGSYMVTLKAKGDLRKPSDLIKAGFKVRNGDRSPASEFTAEVRKSIERFTGWYGIASYLITMVNYSSQNYDVNLGAGARYNAIGGTGRVGVGFGQENRSWGFLGILDLSGFVNKEGQNLTYKSTEISSVYRKQVGERGEFRAQLGGYYKEHQVALGDPIQGVIASYEVVPVLGPHIGTEYWYSLSPKIGFQANAHIYYTLMSMKTPNGEPLVPSMSTQLGVLGSYRFNKRFTGLVGYARREDSVKYKAAPVNPAFTGAVNETVLQGDYLNFFAEYNF